MISSTEQALSASDQLGQITRPARALIGWMTQEEAKLCLAQRQIHNASKPEYKQRAEDAIKAVQAREVGIDQSDLFSEIPGEIAGYIEQLKSHEAFNVYMKENWDFRVADLSKVCALQPIVFWDHAEERTESAIVDDLLSVAEVTLPIPHKAELPIQFDQGRNMWIIASRNPNLRIIGQVSAPVEGKTACGFVVDVTPSFVQVVQHRDRYVLRDGYHRSIGLLSRGITKVPVLFREFSRYDDLGIGRGMLQGQAYLGDRPALLQDYLNDEVAAEVFIPASQKMIVIQGMEMNPFG